MRVMQLNAFVNMHRGFGAKWPIKRMRAQCRMPPVRHVRGGDRNMYIHIHCNCYALHMRVRTRARELADTPPKPAPPSRTFVPTARPTPIRSPSTDCGGDRALNVSRVGRAETQPKARRRRRAKLGSHIAHSRPEHSATRRARAHNTLPFLCVMCMCVCVTHANPTHKVTAHTHNRTHAHQST